MKSTSFIDMIEDSLESLQILENLTSESQNAFAILTKLIQEQNLQLKEFISHQNKEQTTQNYQQPSLNLSYLQDNYFSLISNQTLQQEMLENIGWEKIINFKKHINQIFEELQQFPKYVIELYQNYFSTLDWFIAQYFDQKLTLLVQKDIILENKQINTLQNFTLQMTDLRDNSFFGKFELCQTYYQEVIQILKLKYQGNQVYKDKLKSIVKASKFLDNFQQEAGNAMTILKETELVIRNEDFSKIRLKNCSLAGASFIDCNFKGSILIDVEITSCWLISCCLDEVNWKQITNKVLSGFQGHTEYISSLAFNSNRRILASGSHDKTVRLWNTDDKKMITLFRDTEYPKCLEFSPTGLVLVFGGWENNMKYINVSTGKKSLLLQKNGVCINLLVFSFSGQILASAHGNMSICLWNFNQKKQIRVYQELQSLTICLIFSQNNENLAFGNSDSQIYILDIKIWKIKFILKGHQDSVLSIAYSNNEQYLVSGSKDFTIKIWNLQSQTQVKTFVGHDKPILCVAFSSKDEQVISGCYDGTIRFWNIETSKEISKSIGYNCEPTKIAIFSENFIATSYLFRPIEIQMWNRSELFQNKQQIGHTHCVMSIALTPDGKHLISGSVDKTIKIWNIKSGMLVKQLQEQPSGVYFVAVSPNGKKLASCCLDNLIHVWDLQTYEEIKQLSGHQSQVSAVTFSLDSKYCVTGSSDKTFRLWSIEQGRQLRILENHGYSISKVLFSPNGNLFANISKNNKICIRNTTTYKKLKLLSFNKSNIYVISFSHNNLNVISGNSDRLLYIWNIQLGNLIFKLHGHSNIICSIAISSNDQLIVSGSRDNIIKIWDVKSGKETQTLNCHKGCINSIVINDQFLISGCADDIVFWETKIINQRFHNQQIIFRPIKILSQFQRKNYFAQSTFNDANFASINGENLIRSLQQNISFQ